MNTKYAEDEKVEHLVYRALISGMRFVELHSVCYLLLIQTKRRPRIRKRLHRLFVQYYLILICTYSLKNVTFIYSTIQNVLSTESQNT